MYTVNCIWHYIDSNKIEIYYIVTRKYNRNHYRNKLKFNYIKMCFKFL